MFNNFDEDARKILVNAKLEMKELRHPYVGSEHLLLAILKEKNDLTKKLKEYNLTYDIFKKELINIIGLGTKESEIYLYTPLLKRVLETAILDSKEDRSNVTIYHLLSSLLEEGEGIAIRIMMSLNIDLDKLSEEFMYKPNIKKLDKLLIEELGEDLTKKALSGELDPVIGREKEKERLLEILSRRCKNNPILVGEAGVGKTAIVEELAKMIVNNEVPLNLRGKRIISVDMASLVAGTKYRGEFEDKIKKILKEIEDNKDIILFIDEIHTLVGAGGAEGAIDASNILKPALARGKIRCIGATTLDEYKTYIEKDKALDRRFQKILVEVPNKEDTKKILMNVKNIYESYHSVSIKEEIIDLIINLSNKYIYDRNEPDKSLDILDEVCASVNIKEYDDLKKYDRLKNKYDEIVIKKKEAIKNNNFKKASKYKDEENIILNDINVLELNMYNKKIKEVKKDDVYLVMSSKTKIPIYEIMNDNKKMISKIKNKLKKEIVGQDKAIDTILNQINLEKNSSMLFIGPSGVGKTYTAKLLGKLLCKNVIKLDMTEFSEPHSISKIIGSPPGYVGYDNYNNVLESVRTNPLSILILDEIDKANQNVLNLFINALEEGYIKDSKGRLINMSNVTIIMTSKALSNNINVGFVKKCEKYDIPYLSKIDKTIRFNYLNEKDIIKLIKTKYNINDDKTINEIIKLSDYKEYGARKIDKIIKDKNIVNSLYIS